MSLDPILWAMKDAPVADTEEFAVLATMGEAADEDGCNAFQSIPTIARRTRLDPQTVRSRLQAMVKRGLLALGDQETPKINKIPRHLRPTVYDLQIPYSWFGKPERVNEYRQGLGREPLTPEDRPDLPPAPERKRRADLGKPRKRPSSKDEGVSDTQGVSTTEGVSDTSGPPVYDTGEGVSDTYPTHPSNPPQDSPQEGSPSSLRSEGPQGASGDEQGQGSLLDGTPGWPGTSTPRDDEDEGKPEPAPRRKRRTQVPEGFTPDERLLAWASEHAPDVADLPRETQRFVDYHRSKGTVFVDHRAAWRTWVGKAQQDAERRRPRGGQRRAYNDADRWGQQQEAGPGARSLTDAELDALFAQEGGRR